MDRSYVGLEDFKGVSALNITGTSDDAELLAYLEAATEAVENEVGRQFQPYIDTRYYTAEEKEHVWVDDLLSITSLKTDEDRDGTYEVAWDSSDYALWPYNGFPKLKIERDIRVADPEAFPIGVPLGVEVQGLWGYGDGESATPYTAATSLLNGAVDASATSVVVDDGSEFQAGQTILVDSEQMYVTSITGNTLTVKRGVNGTTAATHDDDSQIHVYRYPKAVVQATLITATRWWKRREAAFSEVAGLDETGRMTLTTGLDKDVKVLLSGFYRFV